MRAKATAAALLAVAAATASTAALAQHRFHGGPRVHFGVVVGAPLFWHPAPYYYYPPYYYPPAVVVPQSPPTYVEKSDAAEDAQSFWYWCADAKAYYPYVKQCPGGWQRVAPQSAPG